jgi:hypothetical protein
VVYINSLVVYKCYHYIHFAFYIVVSQLKGEDRPVFPKGVLPIDLQLEDHLSYMILKTMW